MESALPVTYATNMSPTVPDALQICADLCITPQQLLRLETLLRERPLRLSELAERGWQTPLGQQVLPGFTYFRGPAGYVDWRSFVGAGLFLDAAADHGLVGATTRLTPFVLGPQPAAVRFVRRSMAADLLAAGRYPVEPALQAPIPRLLLVLPAGIGELMVSGITADEPVVLGVELRDGEHGLALRITAWGRSGCSWTTPWQGQPADDLLSVISWGAVGLLASDAAVVEHHLPPQPTGRVLRRSARPEPTWLSAPTIHRYLSREEQLEMARGHLRPHWRRGYQRQQPHGPRNSLRKLVWIPPVWVQGSSEENG